MDAHIALVTCSSFPDGDEQDGALLVQACARAGLQARWRCWDDPNFDWASVDLAVIRATWDYPPRRAEFLAWTDSVPALANPASVMAWNSDKRYLRELADRGLPVVPTTWADPGEPVVFPADHDFVVKPSVGAGSLGAGRFAGGDRTQLEQAYAHAAYLHRNGRTVMVQPYLSDVDTQGESALIYIGGRYSHSVRKAAMLPEPVAHQLGSDQLAERRLRSDPSTERRLRSDPSTELCVPHLLYVGEHITARTATPAELATADAVLAAVPDAPDLLYARVDLLPTPSGPVLIELELIEPSLFLSEDAESADRFALAIAGRVGT